MTTHKIFDGRINIYKRERSRYWQCSAYIEDTNYRVSTREESLAKAKDFAEDWYLELRGKHKRGELKMEKSFAEAAEQYLREYEIITEGTRSPVYIQDNKARLENYLLPYFGEKGLSEITAGLVQEYRIHRKETFIKNKPPSRSTMHKDIVLIRQVLKTAIRHGWMTHLPDLSMPYKTAGKITHRAWFSPEEYKRLYEATRRRAQNPKRKRWAWQSQQLHDYVLFMANTGLRPDEAARLEYRDISIVHDDESDETILEIEVRGKRGVGYCKSTSGAVRPFERLKARNPSGPTDRLFPKTHADLLNTVLIEEDLKFDREGQRRTAYSLRHTYICLRLMEGADIYQIAKNCRTSVEMIETYYASHIKTSLNASAINVRRPKKRKKQNLDESGEQGYATA